MSTAPNYTDWPTAAMVTDRVASFGVTLRAALDTNEVTSIISAIVAEVQRETKRQFKTSTSDRYFHGTGTGELEVDEFVTLNSVSVIGYFGTAGLNLPQVKPFETMGSPTTRIMIARGSLPTQGRVWLDRFPEGRGNIVVNALWGYASTIPQDLWEAIRNHAAATVMTFSQTTGGRMIDSVSAADEKVSYMDQLPIEILQSRPMLDAAIKRYRKPASTRLRRLGRQMI